MRIGQAAWLLSVATLALAPSTTRAQCDGSVAIGSRVRVMVATLRPTFGDRALAAVGLTGPLTHDVVGDLVAADVQSIDVRGSDDIDIPCERVIRMDVSVGRSRHPADGLLMGSIAGGVAGGAVSWSTQLACRAFPPGLCTHNLESTLAGGAVGAVAGGAIGLVLGAIIPKEEWRSATAPLAVAPIADGHGVGLRVTVHY